MGAREPRRQACTSVPSRKGRPARPVSAVPYRIRRIRGVPRGRSHVQITGARRRPGARRCPRQAPPAPARGAATIEQLPCSATAVPEISLMPVLQGSPGRATLRSRSGPDSRLRLPPAAVPSCRRLPRRGRPPHAPALLLILGLLLAPPPPARAQESTCPACLRMPPATSAELGRGFPGRRPPRSSAPPPRPRGAGRAAKTWPRRGGLGGTGRRRRARPEHWLALARAQLQKTRPNAARACSGLGEFPVGALRPARDRRSAGDRRCRCSGSTARRSNSCRPSRRRCSGRRRPALPADAGRGPPRRRPAGRRDQHRAGGRAARACLRFTAPRPGGRDQPRGCSGRSRHPRPRGAAGGATSLRRRPAARPVHPTWCCAPACRGGMGCG